MTIITPKLLKKPSGILSAPLSRFFAATLFALLFIAQPSNAQTPAEPINQILTQSANEILLVFSGDATLGGVSEADFSVAGAASNPTVSSVGRFNAATTLLLLTLSADIVESETITLSYTKGTTGSITVTGQNTPLASFTNKAVTNLVQPDTRAPVVKSAETNTTGDSIALTFNEAININDAVAADFTVTAGKRARTIAVTTLTANEKTLTLELTSAIAQGETVLLEYATKDTGIADAAGNVFRKDRRQVTNEVSAENKAPTGHLSISMLLDGNTVTATRPLPAGQTTLSATPTVGNTLTAVTSEISDADGPETLSFSYQWQAGGDDIAAATAETFTLTNAQLGKQIKVIVRYTDAAKRVETLASAQTNQVGENTPPTASAGPDQIVNERVTVTLDGSGSSDPDGDTLSYSWIQIGDTSATLSKSNTASPTFIAPAVTGKTLLTFELTVTDNFKVPKSGTDTVIITINPANTPPTANAGPDQIIGSGSAVRGSQDDTPGAADEPEYDQTVTEMSRITLDGTGSTDLDGIIISYKWTLVSGTHPPLLKGFAENDAVASPTFFTPPTSARGATLVFSLVVTDNGGAVSMPDNVVIRVTGHNVQPIAHAGVDQSVDENTLVTLDGTGSSDPDGHTLSYSWALTDFPTSDSSPVIPPLSDPTVASPTFTAPEVSGQISLLYTLTVTDNAEASKSHTDAVRININNVVGGTSAVDDDGAIMGASDEVGMHSSPQNTPNKSASLLKVFNGSQYVDFVRGVTIQTGVPKFKGTSSGISSVQVLLNNVQVGGNNISSNGTFRKGWKHTPLADGTYTISINNNKGGRELFSSSIIIDKDSDGNPSVSATINKVDAALSPFDLTVMMGKTAAIGDELSVKDISISPNPTSGILNITVNEKAYYKLLNIRGQTLKTGVLSTRKSKIDISSFAKGIYLLNIKTSKESFTEKVIKD